MKLTEDVVIHINEEFGSLAESAIHFLHNQPEPNHESHRVLRCIVFLAEGKIDLLEKLVDSANADYRDVIFWAEYINHKKANPDRIRNFNKLFGQHELKMESLPKQELRLPPDVKKFFARKK